MSRDRFVNQIWSEDNPGGIVAPDVSTQENGYGPTIPPAEEHNWLFNLFTDMLKNAEENGIMEWNTNTVYTIGALSKASDGDLYKSLEAANQGNDPVSEPTKWSIVNFPSLSDLATLVSDGDYYTAAGADTITLSSLPGNQSPTTFTKGKRFRFVAVGTNSGAVTITTPNIISKPLTIKGTPLVAGDIELGKSYEVWVNTAETEYYLHGVILGATETTKGIVEKATIPEAQTAVIDKFIDAERLHEVMLGGATQSRVDFLGVKDKDTPYTNTTGQITWVSVSCGIGLEMAFKIDGVEVAKLRDNDSVSQWNLSEPVQPGSTYEITATGLITKWFELTTETI